MQLSDARNEITELTEELADTKRKLSESRMAEANGLRRINELELDVSCLHHIRIGCAAVS